jgi:hypothetical protein
LTAVLWQQLEQSGLLQKLPALLTLHTSQLQHKLSTLSQPEGMDGTPALANYQTDLLDMLKLIDSVQRLQPAFLTAHAAGQQCVVPAMQLGMTSMRYISVVLAQEGGRGPQQ